MMKSGTIALCLLPLATGAALGSLGCATTGHGATRDPWDPLCLATPPRVEVEDVDGGVAITITSGTQTEEIRGRMTSAAASFRATADDEGAGMEGCGMGGGHHGGGHHGGGGFPPVNVSVDDVAGGARLVLIAADSSDVRVVRAQARARAAAIQAGRCGAATGPAGSHDH